MTFEPHDRELLARLADVLIPAAEKHLSASQAGVAEQGLSAVLAARPDLAAPLRTLLIKAQGRDPATAVAELQATDPAAFGVLAEIAASAYFLNPLVQAAIGYQGQTPRPIDPRPDYMEDGLLESVIRRGPIYRPSTRPSAMVHRHVNATPRYVAALSNVNEVSLVGTADLSYWKAHVGEGALAPAESQGKAQLLVSASAARFIGLPFAEFSVCVLVVPPLDCGWRDAAYLVHAFNSRRFFALCERILYATPYYHGRIGITTSFPPSVQVRADDGGTYCAALRIDSGDNPRQPSRSAAECWNGPVFLPGRRVSDRRASLVFFAKLQGLTRVFPYVPSRDLVQITSASAGSVFQMLIDSGFEGQEWIVREAAMHAKSKTYPAPEAIASYRPDAA